MNQFRKNIETETNETKAPVNAAADEAIKKATEFTFLDKETLNKALQAIIFCVVIAIVYISLSHFHVKSLKKKAELKTELNELRSEYITVKSSLMKKSSQSEVAKDLMPEGVKELRTPPFIILKEKNKK